MTMPRSLVAVCAFALAGLAPAQQASVEPRAPGAVLRDTDGGFALDLTVEAAAGERAEGGGFTVEFLGAEPPLAPPVSIFTDGFEPGDSP